MKDLTLGAVANFPSVFEWLFYPMCANPHVCAYANALVSICVCVRVRPYLYICLYMFLSFNAERISIELSPIIIRLHVRAVVAQAPSMGGRCTD